jgi:multicomponent Na+:H+ antiporter subunit D
VSDLPVSIVVGGWTRISGIEIEINSLNYYLILVELIVFSLVGVYSLFYFDSDKSRDGSFSSKFVFPLILLLYSGILGCFLTRDLFNFYVYMEIASLSSIILVAYSKEKGAIYASYRYLMMFFLSSFLFIFAIGIIYIKTGTLNFNLIQQNLIMSREIRIAITIAFIAFITKAGIFPLHYWLPEAHSKAETPVSALLSGLTVKVPIAGMLLFLTYMNIEFLMSPLRILAFGSIFFGIIMAILQSNVKKILAYSTVSQMGFILLAISTLNAEAAVYYAFAHALFKSGLFLGMGVLIKKQGTKDIDELFYREDSLIMISLIILTLAIGGFSPLIGAFGKHEILSALSGYWIYLFYMGSIGTFTYFINLNYKLFDYRSLTIPSFNIESVITFIIALLTVLFGIFYYPNLNNLDLILIAISVLIFIVFNYMDVFEKTSPTYFKRDIRGLGSEINFYTAIFVFVNILLLVYILY